MDDQIKLILINQNMIMSALSMVIGELKSGLLADTTRNLLNQAVDNTLAVLAKTDVSTSKGEQ